MNQLDSRWDPVFEAFVAASSARLLRTGYLLTGDRLAAEDLVQQTLVQTAWHWTRAQRAPEAYARRVLVNLSRDQHRRTARIEAAGVRGLTSAGQVPHGLDPAEAVADREQVIEALGRLPIEYREVLVLRFYADLAVAEVAAAIGKSQGTVKSRTSRALARMRELLAGQKPERDERVRSEVSDEQR